MIFVGKACESRRHSQTSIESNAALGCSAPGPTVLIFGLVPS